MSKVQHFIGHLQHMADSAVLAMIAPEELARIKAIDAAPIIKVYGIGHEGKHEAQLLGGGASKLTKMEFVRDALRAMYDKIATGTKAFVGHGKGTNAHEGRAEVGEIIGKAQVEKDGGLFNMVAVWIKDRAKADTLDVASIEQAVAYEHTADGIIVRDVEQVTGVALGNSMFDKPGFPGATLLASMQAFQKEHVSIMTADEIRKATSEAGLKPGDIFSKTVLRQDELVRELMQDHSQKEFEHRQAVEKKLDEAKEKLTAFEAVDLDALKAKAAKADKLESSTHLEQVLKDSKLNDKQAAFVRDRFAKSFTPSDGDLVKAVKEHVDTLAEEYREMAKLFGIKLDDAGAPPGDSSDSAEGDGEPDYTDPKFNPAIPKPDTV